MCRVSIFLSLLFASACEAPALMQDHDAGADAAALGPGWSVAAPGSVSKLRAIWGSSADDVYAVGDAILHSTDRGLSWATEGASPLGGAELEAVWGSGPDDVYAVGRLTLEGPPWVRSVALHSVDHGASWVPLAPLPDGGARSVFGSGRDDVWVAGAFGIARTEDRGASWISVATVANPLLGGETVYHGLWVRGPADVYALRSWCCPSGAIQQTADRGLSWTRGCSIDPGFSETQYGGLIGFDDGSLWAIGSDIGNAGFVVAVSGSTTTDPRGTRACWRDESSHTSRHALHGLWGASAADLWVSGAGATYLRRQGGAWAAVEGAPQFDAVAIWGSGASDVYFVGADRIAHYAPR